MEQQLKKHGMIMHCWRAHVARMKRLGLHYVSYSSFKHRVIDHNWSVYRAICTPADVRFRQQRRKKDMRCYQLYCNVKHFFRKLYRKIW